MIDEIIQLTTDELDEDEAQEDQADGTAAEQVIHTKTETYPLSKVKTCQRYIVL